MQPLVSNHFSHVKNITTISIQHPLSLPLLSISLLFFCLAATILSPMIFRTSSNNEGELGSHLCGSKINSGTDFYNVKGIYSWLRLIYSKINGIFISATSLHCTGLLPCVMMSWVRFVSNLLVYFIGGSCLVLTWWCDAGNPSESVTS